MLMASSIIAQNIILFHTTNKHLGLQFLIWHQRPIRFRQFFPQTGRQFSTSTAETSNGQHIEKESDGIGR
jgi:hypothetical protein